MVDEGEVIGCIHLPNEKNMFLDKDIPHFQTHPNGYI
jgi:hypothetical protein